MNGVKIKMVDDYFRYIVLGIGSLTNVLIGSWLPMFTFLLVLQGVDIVSGMMASGVDGKRQDKANISSERFFQGLFKKGGGWLLIILANTLDAMAFNHLPVVKTIACSYLLYNEGLSIIENLGVLGVPIPPQIKKYLERLKQDVEETELNTDKEKEAE